MKENEWKELEIGNLPSDIAVAGSYEFNWRLCVDQPDEWFTLRSTDRGPFFSCILEEVEKRHSKLIYRKRQPKAPTHEEIMSLWFNTGGRVWERVAAFDALNKEYFIGGLWCTKDRISKKQSAIIPPKGN